VRAFDGTDQLVSLICTAAVSRFCMFWIEHHQNDGRRRVDRLPRVAVWKIGPVNAHATTSPAATRNVIGLPGDGRLLREPLETSWTAFSGAMDAIERERKRRVARNDPVERPRGASIWGPAWRTMNGGTSALPRSETAHGAAPSLTTAFESLGQRPTIPREAADPGGDLPLFKVLRGDQQRASVSSHRHLQSGGSSHASASSTAIAWRTRSSPVSCVRARTRARRAPSAGSATRPSRVVADRALIHRGAQRVESVELALRVVELAERGVRHTARVERTVRRSNKSGNARSCKSRSSVQRTSTGTRSAGIRRRTAHLIAELCGCRHHRARMRRTSGATPIIIEEKERNCSLCAMYT
jgi:hypothetical protein